MHKVQKITIQYPIIDISRDETKHVQFDRLTQLGFVQTSSSSSI